MAEIISLPFDEEREWRTGLNSYRETIREAGASPKVEQLVLEEFREIHRKIRYPNSHQLVCPQLTQEQQQAVDNLVENIRDSLWLRISIAEVFILNLLVEKYR